MEQRLSRVLDRPTFNALMQLDNRVALFHLAIRLLAEVGILLVLALFSSDYICIPFLILLLGFWHSFWGYAGYSHELFHGRVFSSKKLNRVLFVFSTAITYNNRAFFEASHSKHHQHTFHETDEEALNYQSWGRSDLIQYCRVDFRSIFRKLGYTFKNAVGLVPEKNEQTKSLIIRSAFEIIAINSLIYGAIWFLSGEVFVSIYFFIAQF